MNHPPDLRTGRAAERGADEGPRKHGRWCEPAKFVLVERQVTVEHEAMEAGRRARGGRELIRLAECEPKRHGPAFFAE